MPRPVRRPGLIKIHDPSSLVLVLVACLGVVTVLYVTLDIDGLHGRDHRPLEATTPDVESSAATGSGSGQEGKDSPPVLESGPANSRLTR